MCMLSCNLCDLFCQRNADIIHRIHSLLFTYCTSVHTVNISLNNGYIWIQYKNEFSMNENHGTWWPDLGFHFFLYIMNQSPVCYCGVRGVGPPLGGCLGVVWVGRTGRRRHGPKERCLTLYHTHPSWRAVRWRAVRWRAVCWRTVRWWKGAFSSSSKSSGFLTQR